MGYLLSCVIFLPLLAATLVIFVPSRFNASYRFIALATSVGQLLILCIALTRYSTLENGYQLIEKLSWIDLNLGTFGKIKIEYLIGVDGLSLPMVVLSVFVMLIAVIASWKTSKNTKGYFILLLILNTAIVGSFCAIDLFLFYVFFEFMLLPMYFLIGIWGGARREYASIKFFLYTLAGSVLILIVMIGLYISTSDPSDPSIFIHSFNMSHMVDPSNSIHGSILSTSSHWKIWRLDARSWAFLFLLVGFGIKLPIVPLHTWLPDAHVEAPTAISVVLAALLLKIGGYGLMRLAYPVFPEAAIHFSWLVGGFGVVSIIYGALNALAAKDLKRLIAYSSVSHMGFVLLGLASATTAGVTGAVYQMFSHGLISAMLFVLAGVLQDRTGDRTIGNYSGLSSVMRAYTAFILIAFFASMSLPGFSGFIAEVFVFLGAFESAGSNNLIPGWMAAIAPIGLILGAGYYLWTIQRMFYGPLQVRIEGAVMTDLTTREYVILIPLAAAILFFGIFPQVLLDVIEPFAKTMAESISKIQVLSSAP